MFNGNGMATGSDMVGSESICSAKDIHKFKFLKILCQPKKTPVCFLPFGHQLVTPEEKTKYVHLNKISLMNGNSDFLDNNPNTLHRMYLP